jgi:D-alanyl-D-alanine carboxypeptidase/D-alanyl-D-alanine-endopeptidase (penicillin-binding protein 4)
MTLRVTPGAPGKPPIVIAPAYVRITNEALTLEGAPQTLAIEHRVNSRDFRLYGEMPVGGKEWTERIGIDDPADLTAKTFAAMLHARGVKVMGKVQFRHRAVSSDLERPQATEALYESDWWGWGAPLAVLVAPPLAEDVMIINKVSQNQHAEQLLRRIGKMHGTGSLNDGLNAERTVFDQAGIPREGYDFSDGSGMSTYNRVSPRAGVALLRWINTQPWGPAWYASLPIAGVDGTLKRRFIGTPLEGNLTAKTGTLNATNAISGRFRAASGKMLTFSFFANDVSDGQSVLPAMEAVLLLIAASN